MKRTPAQTVRVHDLKTLPQFFREVLDGRKHTEFRRFDRDFRVGDWLLLSEHDPNAGYSGRELVVKVKYIFVPNEAPDFCVMEVERW